MTSTSADIATKPFRELAAAVRGDLIVPGDRGYEEARAVYNGMIGKHPAAIARCRDAADVISCVRFARAHGAEIAVRGGGHSAAGLGVGNGALVIDLSLLRSTTVDPAGRTVRADAGCTWGDVDHATVAFGMATPSGFIASTGVAGLTLGGGTGYLTRRFGLTVDNLLSADAVQRRAQTVGRAPPVPDGTCAPGLTRRGRRVSQPQEETQFMTLTSATATTQAVVNHHLERFAALDLQGIVADYAPDAMMIVPTGVLRGVQEITPLLQNLFAEFAKPGATFDLQQQVIEGDVAYIWWVAQTPDNTYELGTDTFFVRHGKIEVQTFAYKATPRA